MPACRAIDSRPPRRRPPQVMFLIWGVLAPAAVYVARYCKARAWWVTVHGGCMAAAVCLSAPLAWSALVSAGASARAHGVLGIALLGAAAWIQAALGYAAWEAMRGGRAGRRVQAAHVMSGARAGGIIAFLARG